MNKKLLHFRKIVQSLRLLVAPAPVQAAIFEPFVDVPFEVLDTYRNAFLLTPNLIEQGMFGYPQIANLIRLNNSVSFLLAEISSDECDECSASVVTLRETVRRLAEELLDSLGEAHEPIDPNLV